MSNARRIIGSSDARMASMPPAASSRRHSTSPSLVPSISSTARRARALATKDFDDQRIVAPAQLHVPGKGVGKFHELQIVIDWCGREELLFQRIPVGVAIIAEPFLARFLVLRGHERQRFGNGIVFGVIGQCPGNTSTSPPFAVADLRSSFQASTYFFSSDLPPIPQVGWTPRFFSNQGTTGSANLVNMPPYALRLFWTPNNSSRTRRFCSGTFVAVLLVKYFQASEDVQRSGKPLVRRCSSAAAVSIRWVPSWIAGYENQLSVVRAGTRNT